MTNAPHNRTQAAASELEENSARVLAYHQLSKHQPHRYADSAGYLDWANQPDPFRTFAGAPRLELPLLADALHTTYANLFQRNAVPPRRVDVHSIAILFELALGLSAWKEYQGSRWALRCNPSSGNLHPTEGYAILPPLPGAAAGLYHYVSRDHILEQRRAFTSAEATGLTEILPPGSFLLGLTSIHWREAWKYGVRAYRYCQHDVGHALAAICYAAATLGWSARLLTHLGDAAGAAWLGLNGDGFAGLDPLDREHPDTLLLVSSAPATGVCPPLVSPEVSVGCWGQANQLSREHVRWAAIDEVAAAARQPMTEADAPPPLPELPPPLPASAVPAATLIRQRRSCLGLDGRTTLDTTAFYRVLDCLLPRPGVPPWDLLPWAPLLHPAIFIHRVRGLTPGLYLFERSPTVHEELKAACRSEFHWQRPDSCPEHLPLYCLKEGDYRKEAELVSCHQDIAADGAFSLGMLAAFSNTLRQRGPWWYRRLFWEAGVLGQVLYLEAEAAGVRGTGIGCYFDDIFHRLLGLTGDTWQDLYHFTVGGPVEDQRLRTLAPYAHLKGR